MEHELGFQTVMRRFLKGDEGMIPDVIYWLKHHSEKQEYLIVLQIRTVLL